MAMQWSDPGAVEITEIAKFVRSETLEIHDGLGGSSRFDMDRAKFVQPQPYVHLEEALKFYIPASLGIDCNGYTWDDLCEKITQAETRYSHNTGGTWHSIWYKVGNYKETLDGWVALIPEAYGLAVVKTGLAVVFKLAEHSAEKRKLIFNVFASLRDALTEADPARTSFQANRYVRECASSLYETIVSSIEEMILLTTKEKSTWRNYIPRLKQKKTPLDLEKALKDVKEHTRDFQNAVRIARDQTIERTAVVAHFTGMKSVQVHHDVKATKNDTELIKTGLEKQVTNFESFTTQMSAESASLRKGINVNTAYIQRGNDENAANFSQLRGLIMNESARISEIADRENNNQDLVLNISNQFVQFLITQVRDNTAFMATQFHHIPKGRAVVSKERFFQILAQPIQFGREPPNLDHIVQHPSLDLDRALRQRGRVKVSAQGQVQSLLRYKRFIHWINRNHPDLILVNANIRSTSQEQLSAISIFCATFVTSMKKVQPHEVVAYFFCGLHTAHNDPWHGPNGLVRSIIIQLLMKLVEREILDLDFINNRDYLRALEEHNLYSLCHALHSLVSQFQPDTSVYCIIDSISCFDKDTMFGDLKFVMEYLNDEIVNDKSLIPMFKVLLTHPMQSTRRIKESRVFADDPSKLVNLSSNNSVPMEMSNLGIEACLLRPSTPTPPWLMREPEHDEGWQTE